MVNTLIVTGPVEDRSRLLTAVSSRVPGQVIQNRDGSTFTGRELVRAFDLDKIVRQPADQQDNWAAWRRENWGVAYNAPQGAAVRVAVSAAEYVYTIPLDGIISRKVLHTLAENYITLKFELKVGEHSVSVWNRGVEVGEYNPYPAYDDDDCGDTCDDDDAADETERGSDDPLEN